MRTEVHLGESPIEGLLVDHRHKRMNLGCGREWCGVGIVRDFGMDTDTLLYVKRITNKDLLYSTGTPLGVMKQTGRAGSLGRVDTCVSMAESLGCSPETITLLLS